MQDGLEGRPAIEDGGPIGSERARRDGVSRSAANAGEAAIGGPGGQRHRRAWLIDAGRLVWLGALAALGAVLGSRAASAGCAAPRSPCEACGWWKGCDLPKAAAARAGRRTDEVQR
ncbi:MAG: hypothetical protein FJ297_05000 [Planctomycetes bacterium]|nr:hypothetical protein [Planctomycetota bacterium]